MSVTTLCVSPEHAMVADAAAQLGATDGEIVARLVRRCRVDRAVAASWVRANKVVLDEARQEGCLQLREHVWAIARGEVDASGSALRATLALGSHHLGMTPSAILDQVAKTSGGKAAQTRAA
jgi:hypothetical protein